MEHETKHKTKHKRFYPVSVILSYILTVLLTVIGYLTCVSLGLFRSDLILECAEHTSYYQNVYDDLVEKCVSLGKPMMLPEETFQDIFTASDIREDVKKAYYARLGNHSHTPDTSKIRAQLMNNIEQFAKEEEIEISEEQEKTIDSFVTVIEKEYTESIEIPFISYYIAFRSMYNRFFIILICVFAVLAIADILLLLKSHKYKHRSVRYITYANLASAILTGGTSLAVFIWGGYKRLNIRPEYFYNLVVDMVNRSLYYFMYAGIFFIVASVVLILLTVQLKKKVAKH